MKWQQTYMEPIFLLLDEWEAHLSTIRSEALKEHLHFGDIDGTFNP